MHTKNIRDQIIAGLADGEAVEDLLKEKNLTLDTALSKFRAHEAAKCQRAGWRFTRNDHTCGTPKTAKS